MAHDDIPEDRELSYPCPECDRGNVTQKGAIWACDSCDFSYLSADTLDHRRE